MYANKSNLESCIKNIEVLFLLQLSISYLYCFFSTVSAVGW